MSNSLQKSDWITGIQNKITPKNVLIILIYIGLMLGGVFCGNAMFASLRLDAQTASTLPLVWLLVPVFIVYYVTSGLPFVPSSEIGFGLLIIFGGEMAPIIIAVSSAGLITSFLVGKFVPKQWLVNLLEWFGLIKASSFLRRIDRMSPDQKLDYMMQGTSKTLGAKLIKYRYFGIIALLNIPGNAVIGGGGGISFMAGVTGFFSPIKYAIAAIIAVSPYPMFFYIVWLLGY